MTLHEFFLTDLAKTSESTMIEDWVCQLGVGVITAMISSICASVLQHTDGSNDSKSRGDWSISAIPR
jgi:hypothetical protein